jgi:lipopolysaccharide heptosyltransferase I
MSGGNVSHLDRNRLQPDRILVVRLSAMGDAIHTLPAVVALRQAFPHAIIGWIIEERWAELLCALRCPRSGTRSAERPLVDKIHTLNTAVWRKTLLSSQTWEQMASSLSELRAAHYQVAVDFQGAVRSAVLARVSGAETTFGVAQPRENAASMWYTRQVIVRGTHIIEQNHSLAVAITGCTAPPPDSVFPTDPFAEGWTERYMREQFALLNPGAGWGAKQWPAERYGRVARELQSEGLRSLVNFGPGEEDLAHEVEAASDGAAEAVACSLSQLISLTRRASLFIGGDTGPMHLAAAMKVPVVGIFGPTNPARNGPFATRSVVLRNPASPTTHARRAAPDEGLLTITVEDVLRAARHLLRGPE